MSKTVPRPGSTKSDTARYVLTPDREFARPMIVDPNGNGQFTWPLGTEGFDFSGANSVIVHRPPGSNQPILDVTFRDEQRITLEGVFPGHTSTKQMNALRALIEREPPRQGFILYVPFLLVKTQYVTVESYRYSHTQQDFTQDITYSLTFIKQGVGSIVKTPVLERPVEQPTTAKPPRGKGQRVFHVDAAHRDLLAISTKLFKTSSKWRDLYSKNQSVFKKLKVSGAQAPHYRLPLGTAIHY